ncbi:hypothetical protein SAMN05414139_04288 [Burkholderia sp. D7]|nr:hypothetical protein SAMN05414139_04288 [Burkholderia sp. D7]
MNTKQSKKGHLEAAASHHEQAARFHREASHHFEAGKDHDHAAHQAVMAHGHALHAIDEANSVVKHNAGASTVLPPPSGSGDNTTAAQHHATAAELHGQAAQHLRHAAKLFDDDRSAVAHDTQLAFSLAVRALAHGNEAARQHVTAVREKSPVSGAA